MIKDDSFKDWSTDPSSREPVNIPPPSATLALAPLPQEISEASRLGLITPDQYVRDLVRHVEAEMRRNGELAA